MIVTVIVPGVHNTIVPKAQATKGDHSNSPIAPIARVMKFLTAKLCIADHESKFGVLKSNMKV